MSVEELDQRCKALDAKIMTALEKGLTSGDLPRLLAEKSKADRAYRKAVREQPRANTWARVEETWKALNAPL